MSYYSRGDDYYDDVEEALPELEGLIDTLKNDHGSYCEKMGHIAQLLRSIVLAQEYVQSFKNFEDLNFGFYEAYSVTGSVVADIMGYASFEKMCKYAPEIVGEISIEWVEEKDAYIFKARNVSAQDEQLQREQKIGITELQYAHGTEGRMKRYIDEMIRDKIVWPTEAELKVRFCVTKFMFKGRMKICLALEDAGGAKNYVHLSALQAAYEKRHGEKLSTETYRKYFTFRETKFNVADLLKERMNFELSIRPARNSSGMKNNLEFMLRNNRSGHYAAHPIVDIERYHRMLSDRRQHDTRSVVHSQPAQREAEAEALFADFEHSMTFC